MSATVNDSSSRLIKYPEERAVEDAAFGQGLIPTRLCRMLLPVWRVDVQATIFDSEPYDLIDRFLEAAIVKGGIQTEEDISEFYGLDQAVVVSASRFLESIRHLSRGRGGELKLLDLGLQSVREGKRYTRELTDRRHLYFDGFNGTPLTRPFYDDRVVTFIDGERLARVVAEAGGGPGQYPARGAFTLVMPIPPRGFGPQTLTVLAQLPAAERERFNLPEQVVNPTLAGPPEQVYLPAYVVRAVDEAGVVGYLAYTQASQEADPEWSQVCSVAEEVAVLVENEYQSGRDEGEEKAARRWAEKRSPGGQYHVGWRSGLLVATFPASAFTGGGRDTLPPQRIGSFVKMDGWYFRVWCDDQRLRVKGLLDLADSYLGSRSKVDPDTAVKRLARFGRQTGFGPLSPEEIAHLARNAGKKQLAEQVDKLDENS
jgi:hypothetical protein